jgi:type VI secretion system secreted protein Hcp
MATNFFIKFENPAIKGEATTKPHDTGPDIDVLSWSHSFNQPTKPTRSTAGGGTVEKANHSDFTITKYLDAATDDLLKYCWSGKQIGKGTFSAYRSDGETNNAILYLQVIMEKIIISNISFGGGGGDLPTETVALSYGKVQYVYKPQMTADGTASSEQQPTSHDLMTGEVS